MTTAAQRLARTRLAILEQIGHGRQNGPAHPQARPDAAAGPEAHPQPWRSLREAGQRQWARHPARLALQVALPLVGGWARRHPVGFMAVAVLGAFLLARGRPWRHIRLSALALVALKSAHLPSLLLSTLSHSRPPPQTDGAR